MRDKFEIRSDMDKEELNFGLKEHYGYSLLNFSYVIADVLAKNTIFSKYDRFKECRGEISDLKKQVEDLEKIKQKTIKILDSYFMKHYDYPSVSMKNIDYEKRVKSYILIFNLDSFFNAINGLKKPLENIVKQVKPEKSNSSWIPWPNTTKYSHPFSFTNQVAFLWSKALFSEYRNKYRGECYMIHWKNICNLIYWFLEHLDTATYESKLDFPGAEKGVIGGNLKVLKNQYQKIKILYAFPLILSADYIYFPWKIKNPLIPQKIDVHDPLAKGFPVVSVKFYTEKIQIIYKKKNELKKIETSFKKDKHITRVSNYEEKTEVDELLLDIS